jgi:hypothetical protein
MAFFAIPTNPNIFETADFSSRPYVAGYELSVTGLTTLSIQPGCARSVANPANVFYPPINANAPGVITVDVSTVFAPAGLDANGIPVVGTPVGFGGCFPLPLNQVGLAGNNTVFPLLAIGDSSGKLATTVIVPTSGAFLPAGYNTFVRIGQVFIDGTTFNIIPFQQSGHYEVCEYQLASSVSVLNAGAATSATLVDLSAGNGPIVPGSTSKVAFNAVFTPNAQADVASLGVPEVAGLPIVLQGAVAAVRVAWPIDISVGVDPVTGHAGIDYAVTAGTDSLTLEVIGWTDDMAVQLR